MTKAHIGTIERAIQGFQFYQKMKKDWMLGEKSPHPYLDTFTSWIIRGKVYTIAGYSNVGKSKFAYQYVNHFLSLGKKVCFFSLEVDSGMVLRNLIANKMQIDWKDASMSDPEASERGGLSIYDTVYDIQDIISITQRDKPDIIFIDFVQNVMCSGASEYERMSTIARDIQQLAITESCTVFTLSQLSNTTGRDVSKGNTDFISLKWAGELYASSDVVFVLVPISPKEIGLSINKNKFGVKPQDTIVFTSDFSKWHFAVDKKRLAQKKEGF